MSFKAFQNLIVDVWKIDFCKSRIMTIRDLKNRNLVSNFHIAYLGYVC